MKENRKKITILVVALVTMISGIILVRTSYALFSVEQMNKSVITIKAGTMNASIKIDNVVANQLVIPADTVKTFTITLQNSNSVAGKFLFYHTSNLPTGVSIGYLEGDGINVPSSNGVVLASTGKNTYSIKVANETTSSVTIDLSTLGGLENVSLSLPSEGKSINKYSKPSGVNPYIMKILKYDQTNAATKCITGEEATCVEIKTPPTTYTKGTIIKYKVNDNLEKYFYVIDDDGTNLTLQQRENTVNATAWGMDNTKGPTTILSSLESETSTWSNVLDQSYTLGSTVFEKNPYTGCKSVSACSKNTYTLDQRTAKARLITNQEIEALGCNLNYCPIWVYNYLSASIENGGTVNQKTDVGYWTSSAWSEGIPTAFSIDPVTNGYLNFADSITSKENGARAVVKIRKKLYNENIVAIYQYDQTHAATKCITGEESTCVEKAILTNTYPIGTIVKYRVNDSTEKYFHVIEDLGSILKLQQRENTISATSWGMDKTKGPVTVLSALESATSSWNNVLDQNYILGTTAFKTNAYTGCNDSTSGCTINTYTMEQRIAKSRLITNQEIRALGCINSGCPVWVYNYLEKSTNSGGTINQGTDIGYWTSSAYSDSIPTCYAVTPDVYGYLNFSNNVTSKENGARAVVSIAK